jgi:hypothetical protein
MFVMKNHAIICFALICCAPLVLADQIVMKNGDRVTGKIVKKAGKDLVIKTDQFGQVTTSWEQVASVTAEPVTVVLQDGRSVKGTLSTTGDNLTLSSSGTQQTVKPSEVITIRGTEEQATFERLQRPSWLELWTGTGTLGFAGSSGNAHTVTFTTGFTAVRPTNTDKTSLYFSAIKASAHVNGATEATAQAVRGGVSYDHNLNPRLFANVFNDYEYDRFQNLDLRFVAGGGFGYHVWNTPRSAFDILGGGDFNRASFSPSPLRQFGEVFFGDQYSLKLASATSVVQSFRIFDDPAHTGAARVNFDIGSSTKLTKWLNWNLTLSDRFLNEPVPGRKRNDLLYSTGVGITFAR